MSKNLLKVLLIALFCPLALIALNKCVLDPVDLVEFTDKAAEIGGGRVILTSDSEGTAGDKRITGLAPNRYYMIEECNYDEATDSTVITATKFVASSGAVGATLVVVGRLIGTTITGLTNDQIYRVRAADPLTGTVTVHDTDPPGAGTTEPISAGSVTLPYDSLYITVSNPTTYDIVKCSPANTTSAAAIYSSNIITLEGPGTTYDYVFWDATIRNFRVLKVIIQAAPVINGLTVTITPYVHPTDHTFNFNPLTSNFTQAQAIAGLSSLSVTAITTAFTGGIDGWFYNGANISTTATFTKTDTDGVPIDFSVMGTYEFTFVGKIGTSPAVPYSGTYTITITE